MTLKIKISQFYEYDYNPNIEQNQIFFNGTYLNLTSFFTGDKMLKYFNNFYNWHLSI